MVGTWVDGLLDGEIIHMPKGGGMWKGKFKEGKKHGMGMRLWKDGSMEEALWERGKEAKLIRVTNVVHATVTSAAIRSAAAPSAGGALPATEGVHVSNGTPPFSW